MTRRRRGLLCAGCVGAVPETPSQSGGGGAPGGGDDDESIVFYDVPPGKRARTEGGGANAAAAPRPAVWQDGIGFKLLTVSLPGQDGEIANRNAISMRDIVQVRVRHRGVKSVERPASAVVPTPFLCAQNIGEIQWMLVSNFRLEVDFLVQQLPELVTVPKARRRTPAALPRHTVCQPLSWCVCARPLVCSQVFFLNNRQHEDEPDSGSCIKTFLRDNPALQGRFQVYCPAMPKFGTHHTKAVRASMGGVNRRHLLQGPSYAAPLFPRSSSSRTRPTCACASTRPTWMSTTGRL